MSTPTHALPVPRQPSRVARGLRAAAGALAVVAVLLITLASVYLASLPGVGDAQQRVRRVLAAHGVRYRSAPAPRRLGEAIVAVEDENFYSNVVFDVAAGAGRAALAALRTSTDPGGSTIVQQLAKQLYGHAGGVRSTLREIGLGVKLSLHYPKDHLLAMYLAVVYYGHGFWGDAAAARGYFGTDPNALSWAQASLLAGLPQAPSAYDPFEYLALAKQRQRHVLDQLVANRYLTRREADASFAEPLGLRLRLPRR